jgi:lysozyme family protein
MNSAPIPSAGIPAPTSAPPTSAEIDAALIKAGLASDIGFSDFVRELIIRDEAGYVNSATDPGGATRYGFSLRLARQIKIVGGESLDIDSDGDIDADDMKRMPLHLAIRMFHDRFWLTQGFPVLVPYVRRKIANLAVVMGPTMACRILQRAVRACGGPALIDDGVIGPKTADAVSQIGALTLMPAIRSEAAGFFRSLVAARPSSLGDLKGWLNRAYR